MVKNIVFDIGNVLVDFGWKQFYEGFGMPEDVLERVAAATVKDPDWNEIDRGVLSEEEVMNLLVENDPGVEAYIRKALSNINGMLIQFNYAKEWIKDLQNKGYIVYCLSNMSYKACDECSDALDFLPLLDGYVLSCDVKVNKPDEKIYKILFDKYALKADECVFIDDLERNVEAARLVGMKGIVFKSKDETDKLLSEL